MKIKASDIKRLIRLRYSGKRNFEAPRWVVLSEIRTNSGFRSKWSSGKPFTEKYIDMMAFDCWPSSGFLRVAFEIKTSRSDFLEELKKPEKRWLAMMYSHQFYYVAPKGVIKYDELPPECGWMEVKEKDGKLKLRSVCKAPITEASPLPDSFIVSLLRNAYKTGTGKEEAFV